MCIGKCETLKMEFIRTNTPERVAPSDEDFQEVMNSILEELAGVNDLLANL